MGTPKKNVLVTGATGTIGRQLCQALYHDDRTHFVLATALDAEPYYFRDYDRHRFAYKQVDILKSREINNLFLSEVFKQAEIDTVVHLAFANRPSPTRGDGTHVHSLNVEGTKHLVDRSIEVGVQKFAFQSSDSVYRIRAWNPILLDEEADLNFDPDASQYVRDRVDADMICRTYMGSSSACKIVVLRPASIVGRNIHSHWSALFDNHWVIPTVLGFDPMIAPTHANDVIRALSMAVHKDVAGVFNLAGLDVAPLSVFIRLAGGIKMPLPAPVLALLNRVQRALRLTEYNYAAIPEALKYTFLLDTTRAREVLGWTPQYHIKFG